MDLFVDTTLYGYGIAAAKDGQDDPCFMEIDVDRRGSGVGEQLQAALQQHDVVWKDIRHIYISSGPGSFTGIKVGLSWAYGVQRGCSQAVKLAPYSGLLMAAKNLQPGEQIVLPSTRSRGFVVEAGHQPEAMESSSFEAREQKLYVIGEWPAFQERFPEAIVLDRRDVLEQSLKQAIQHRASICVDERPQAQYMRRSTAEENLK